MKRRTQMILPALAFALCQPAAAQSLNERWHGTWSAGKDKLVVDAATFDGCRWVGTRPKSTPKTCVAFYEGTVTRKAMFATLQGESTMVDDLVKNGHTSANEAKQMRAQIKGERTKLEGVSDDSFRVVQTWNPAQEGSGDCSSYLFLDKTTVYSVSQCQGPAAPTFTLTPFSRR